MISVDKVSLWYNKGSEDELKALDNVTLKIKPAEFVVILGHNGSGKSTLSRLFNALILPNEGTVTVDGMSTADDGFVYDIRTSVGMVFQNPDSQLVATTVEDELAFGPENIGVPRNEIVERIEQALVHTSMEKYRKFAPHRLSGGQKQKIAIASVIAMRPKYLVLDEATSMLDPKGQADVLATVSSLNRDEKLAVIMVTQNIHEAFYADRALVMQRGALAYDGDPYELFGNEKLVAKLELAQPVMGKVANILRMRGFRIAKNTVTVEGLSREIFNLCNNGIKR